MESKKIKVLWIGDGVAPTGFSTVNHNIIQYLPKEDYEVHHLAVNYYGDPHNYDHFIYPALTPRSPVPDVYGRGRLAEFVDKDFDIIFILNDIWIIQDYLAVIKQTWGEKKIPKIVVYFPVDGKGYSSSWFSNFDIVTKVVTYTDFGKSVVSEVYETDKLEVIPHGTNLKDFYVLSEEKKKEFTSNLFEGNEALQEADEYFIVLNANRNQPRKRLDISLEGFALFSMDKPENVKYYHHAGLKDAGWDLQELAYKLSRKYGHDVMSRIVVSNLSRKPQELPIDVLNGIYNSCNVGINTSLGEGWGLTATEHAATGAIQIVPKHTACEELFGNGHGVLLETSVTVHDPTSLLERGFVHPYTVASGLEWVYENKEEAKAIAKAGYDKFTSDTFNWKNISQTWDNLFKSIL